MKNSIPFMKIESSKLCKACGVKTNTYRRYLHKEMLMFLLRLSSTAPDRSWASSREILGRSGPKASSDGSYLVHWGLVERRGRGEYRITGKGVGFLLGKRKVPTYMLMRNGEVIGWSPEIASYSGLVARLNSGRSNEHDMVLVQT